MRKSASSSRLLDSHQSHAHEKEHSFARFLARRTDWSKKKDEEHGSQPIINPGLGEGKEVERDGYGHWTRIKLKENGEGVGWTDDGVDVSHFVPNRSSSTGGLTVVQEFHCDGKSMWVKGTISWTERVSAREVVFSKNWARVVILRDVREILKAECDKTDFDGKDYKLAIYAPHHGEAPKEGSRLK